jgi:hypothetical protein
MRVGDARWPLNIDRHRPALVRDDDGDVNTSEAM